MFLKSDINFKEEGSIRSLIVLGFEGSAQDENT